MDTPNGLLNKVWFEVMYFLCRRGQVNLRAMTIETFELSTDSTGKRYIFQKTDELDKNHRDTTTGTVTQGRMYELQGNPACPVESFLKYKSKLNKDINALWQRPLDSFVPEEETWFCKAPLGKNTLANMMATISRQGELSQRYTNHSIRSTAITVLDEAGYEARHIMAISGHRNEASIRSYSAHVSEEQTRRISESLTLSTADDRAVDVYQRPATSASPARSPIRNDSDHPSTPNLNQIMNTVLSPVMSTSTDVFKYNRFDGCTININVQK
ncbi:PREDICTED: uncharacterized protein LOC105327636 [Paramuricea clavata]|uniref:PREDICTED: uncharacterized protein LOC105327636 n=1 Tax=Paramuricea clavata TaxID=317549 RepID=A0A6S7IQ26_PARCT|nr:PREDICTED: uncharacterized protein LOC105327636 [Paramuricea clavata]